MVRNSEFRNSEEFESSTFEHTEEFEAKDDPEIIFKSPRYSPSST